MNEIMRWAIVWLWLWLPIPARADVALRAPELGTAHPTVLQLASPDGRWVVACQARRDTDHDGKVNVGVGHHGDLYGDELVPYLFVDGAGRAIDDVAAADPGGRHLAVVEQGKLVLLDVAGNQRVDLRGADTRDDQWKWGGHRAASIDAGGRRLLWLRGSRPVVRDLQTGSEVELDPGPGELWRATLDPGGGWVTLRMIVKDSDGNGKLEWPSVRTSLASRHCRGPITSYSTYGKTGDDWVERVVPVSGGRARELPDLIRPFGVDLLRRRRDGALILEDPAGKLRELVPASCKGRLLQADPGRGKVVVVCASGALEIHGATLHKSLLPVKQPPPEEDRWLEATPRLVAVDGAVVDLDKDVTGGLAPGQLVAEWGSRGLVFIGVHAHVIDVDHLGVVYPMIKTSRHPLFQSGAMVAIGDLVFDLSAGVVVGRAGGILAVSADGRVLVPAATKGGLPQGPLRWIRPKPVD